jgi:hypothetical protein
LDHQAPLVNPESQVLLELRVVTESLEPPDLKVAKEKRETQVSLDLLEQLARMAPMVLLDLQDPRVNKENQVPSARSAVEALLDPKALKAILELQDSPAALASLEYLA